MKRSYLLLWNKKWKFLKNNLATSKVENASAINNNQNLKTANLLYEKREFEDSLFISIMWCFASRSSEMQQLGFEDFEDKDGQKSFYYVNKKNQRNKFDI